MKKRITVPLRLLFNVAILGFLFALILASGDLPIRTKRLPLLVAYITVLFTLIDMAVSIFKANQTGEKEKIHLSKEILVKTGLSVMFMALTVLLWRLVGFIMATIIIAISFSVFLGAKKRLSLIITSILLSLGIYCAFHIFLQVPLPRSIIAGWLF